MKTLIIYDSNYGNTKLIAEAMAQELDAKVLHVDAVAPEELADLSLLVVGSPINGWRPTVKIGAWLGSLETGQLTGIKAATFDTRVRLFIHGNAAKLMASELNRAGATIVGQPEGFIVKGKEGPIESGELERAREWVRTMKIDAV